MTNIREQLEPTIQSFIKGLNSIEQKTIDTQKDIELELSLSKKINLSLKDQEKEQNKEHRDRQEKLQVEIERFKDLQASVQLEIDRYRSLQNDMNRDARTVRDLVKNTEAERQVAEAQRRKLDSSIKDYSDKTNILKADFNSLEQRTKVVIDREAKSKAKERELLKKEEKLIGDNNALSIREIELKTKFKDLELEQKRANV